MNRPEWDGSAVINWWNKALVNEKRLQFHVHKARDCDLKDVEEESSLTLFAYG